jgi:hypothetical protein
LQNRPEHNKEEEMSNSHSNRTHALTFRTSYHQFYLTDPDSDYDTGRGFWTDEALKRGLAVGEGVIGVSTASYGHVRCFLEIAESEPILPLSPWQRIVEGSIRFTEAGYALICPTDQDPIHEGKCRAGWYRLRVYAAFLDLQVKDTHGDDYFDFYWLVLWRAPESGIRVLKSKNKSVG